MRRCLFAVLVVLYAEVVSAQTGPPTSWNLRTYAPGSSTVVATATFPTSAVSCNQPSEPGVDGVVNPRRAAIDDPANAGRICIFDVVAVVTALPDGAYVFRTVAVNADGTSGESASGNPFVRRRPNPPGVPTGTRALP